jgi:GTPase SAR1 family protein
VTKLNQVLLEYFLPSVLSRINEKNTFYANLKSAQQQEQQALQNEEQLQNQIVEENHFVLMCRDFVELIRVFFNYNNQTSISTTSVGETNDADDANDDENEVFIIRIIF